MSSTSAAAAATAATAATAAAAAGAAAAAAAKNRLGRVVGQLINADDDTAGFVLAPEVALALGQGRPVVALESTIISHGMPYPDNLTMARDVERLVREGGATPATIAILAGRVHVGLQDAELERLAAAAGDPQARPVRKCSRRDLSLAVAGGEDGATTVAATMWIAHRAGIAVFATGGIGGVHRGVEATHDISADLTELGRTPVCVVCAGVKSILDIGRTLEVLETEGVTVVSLAAAGVPPPTAANATTAAPAPASDAAPGEFPAFFTRRSGVQSPHECRSVDEVAAVVAAQRRLRVDTGIVVAVPIAARDEADAGAVQQAIDRALGEMAERGISGKHATPFLLKRVNELTQGKSLAANQALIRQNARVATAVAVRLAELEQRRGRFQGQGAGTALHSNATSSLSSTAPAEGGAEVVVVGGTNFDLLARPSEQLRLHTSNPGQTAQQWGGVARNVAEALARLQVRTQFVSCVGRDALGDRFFHDHGRDGPLASLDTRLVWRSALSATSTYLAVMDERGDLHTTIADMRAIEEVAPQWFQAQALPDKGPPATPSVPTSAASAPDVDWCRRVTSAVRAARLVVSDGNISQTALNALAIACTPQHCPSSPSSSTPLFWFEPTGLVKSLRGLAIWRRGLVHCMSPSLDEVVHMAYSSGLRDPTADSASPAAAQARRRGATLAWDQLAAARVRAARDEDGDDDSSKNSAGGKVSVQLAVSAAQYMMTLLPPAATPSGAASFHIVAKIGRHGCVIVSSPSPASSAPAVWTHVPGSAVAAERVINTSGAGDTLVGATIWHLLRAQARSSSSPALLLSHDALVRAVGEAGVRAAALTIQSAANVHPELLSKL